MYQFNEIDKSAKLVKNIIDTNRCTICDKPNGKRMRYPCGHTSCEDCVHVTGYCQFCLTPTEDYSCTFPSPSIDIPHTQRCQNAIALLNAFQADLGIDVYKRNRISEKLKAEKELFPQCIQAPAKYYNKRKSEKVSAENKENSITIFPGEKVSFLSKMENSNANVREWLKKCVKRKPLGDLNHMKNVNTLQKQTQNVLNTQNILKDSRSYKKRNYSDIWVDENDTVIDQFTPKKHKVNSIEKTKNKINTSTKLKKSNKDDSGIAVDDDDGVIVINDSQSDTVDKDMNAWLAVLEAEKYAQCGSTTLGSKESKHSDKIPQPYAKVPFYIKSSLSENCEHCKNYNEAVNINKESDDQPNISITVESKSFTTIINVSKAQSNKPNAMQSVEVQTDFNLEKHGERLVERKKGNNEIIASSLSEDILPDEAYRSSPLQVVNKSTNVIVAESDSDEDMEHSLSLQVTADVHRSYDEMVVLGTVEDLKEHNERPRRAARGYTPTSTDSSDKENYNPNRTKRSTNTKKKPVKK